jgi:hypothetical protein
MSGAPTSGPKPCTTLNKPGGAPAFRKAYGVIEDKKVAVSSTSPKRKKNYYYHHYYKKKKKKKISSIFVKRSRGVLK